MAGAALQHLALTERGAKQVHARIRHILLASRLIGFCGVDMLLAEAGAAPFPPPGAGGESAKKGGKIGGYHGTV